MDEDKKTPVDQQEVPSVSNADSNRNFVSTNLPTCFSNVSTDNDIHSDDQTNVAGPSTSPTNTDVVNSSIQLDNPHCITYFSSNDVTENDCLVEKLIDFGILLVSPSPLLQACEQTTPDNSLIALLPASSSPEPQVARPSKRKRLDPPQEVCNVRDKLSKYAYTDRNIKNVSFAPQVDRTTPPAPPQASPTSSMEIDGTVAPPQPPPTTSVETNMRAPRPIINTVRRAISMSSLPAIASGLTHTPLPSIPPNTNTSHGSLVVDPALTADDEARNYQVPERMTRMWRLYEHQLRIVGRTSARIRQLDEDIRIERPPSWCYGGTQAPQYLRPFHISLVEITRAYAMTMASAARAHLQQQAEDDAREAEHLRNTLSNMYADAGDEFYELANLRAEGIAGYYTRKEMTLSRRLHDEDVALQPTTRAEWADQLSRRKISKPTTRRRTSRSRSPHRPDAQRPSTSTNSRGQQQPSRRGSQQQVNIPQGRGQPQPSRRESQQQVNNHPYRGQQQPSRRESQQQLNPQPTRRDSQQQVNAPRGNNNRSQPQADPAYQDVAPQHEFRAPQRIPNNRSQYRPRDTQRTTQPGPRPSYNNTTSAGVSNSNLIATQNRANQPQSSRPSTSSNQPRPENPPRSQNALSNEEQQLIAFIRASKQPPNGQD